MHPIERNLAIARVTPASFASFRDEQNVGLLVCVRSFLRSASTVLWLRKDLGILLVTRGLLDCLRSLLVTKKLVGLSLLSY